MTQWACCSLGHEVQHGLCHRLSGDTEVPDMESQGPFMVGTGGSFEV